MVGVPGVIRTHDKNSWGYLGPDAVLISEQLQQSGYYTALIGKWHLGLESPNKPNERGFHLFHGFLGDMMDDYNTHLRHGINYMRHNRQRIDPEGHATDLFSDWACDFIRSCDHNDPFFLYLAYNAPHTPIQPPDDWLERVQKRQPQLSPQRAKLTALIEHMDDGIGKVLQSLKDRGLENETILIFTSDNGGQLSVGADNGPHRKGKGSLYEGGIKVPMCMVWPGKIDPGSLSDRIALTMDIMPTLFEAVGIKIQHPIDGESFLKTALGEEQPASNRDLFWGRREGREGGENPNFPKAGTIYAIRRGDWKLLQSHPESSCELYNLADDPLEQHDLSKQEPDKYNELYEALMKQLDRYSQIPWQKDKAN